MILKFWKQWMAQSIFEQKCILLTARFCSKIQWTVYHWGTSPSSKSLYHKLNDGWPPSKCLLKPHCSNSCWDEDFFQLNFLNRWWTYVLRGSSFPNVSDRNSLAIMLFHYIYLPLSVQTASSPHGRGRKRTEYWKHMYATVPRCYAKHPSLKLRPDLRSSRRTQFQRAGWSKCRMP